MNRRTWIWIAAIVAGIALIAIGLEAWTAGPDRTDKVRMVALSLLAAVYGGAALVSGRWQLGRTLQHAMIWAGIVLVMLIGYTYRDELARIGDRVMAEIVPGRGRTTEGGSITFVAGPDGHFRVDAMVDGVPVTFFVDTGASVVVLSRADAQRIGIDPSRLAYTQTFQTANGTVQAASVRLREVRVGPLVVQSVRAAVQAEGLNESLLGMSFLGRLGGFEMRGGRLILKQ